MVMPVGGDTKENVRVSPTSGSVASTSYVYSEPSAATVTGVDVIVGVSFVLVTSIEKLCVSKADAASVTRTVTGFAPT